MGWKNFDAQTYSDDSTRRANEMNFVLQRFTHALHQPDLDESYQPEGASEANCVEDLARTSGWYRT